MGTRNLICVVKKIMSTKWHNIVNGLETVLGS